MFVFRKIFRALFSCYLHFEIRPFALLPTSCSFIGRYRKVLIDETVFNVIESVSSSARFWGSLRDLQENSLIYKQ